MDVQFGQFRLMRQARLVSGPDGRVDLSARSFDILVTLLERPNEVIGKPELLDAVWPGVIVEENTLQVHVSALRKALDPDMIVTVHGRGYKYAGPTPIDTRGSIAAERQSVRRPVIVVLPFENLSGDIDQQYFSDGITDDLTDRLTRFHQLAVIGSHSAFAFRGHAADFEAIRTRLKADFVVTGSVRRADGRVRIATRLSDALSKTVLWAERYDRSLTGFLDLQDEVTAIIAGAISTQLEVEIAARSDSGRSSNFASYEQILKGHYLFKQLSRSSTRGAASCYQHALAIDPQNAEAMTYLAMCHISMWFFEFSETGLSLGISLARKAADADPSNARCHAVLGLGLVWSDGLDEARLATDRAIALNPSGWFELTNRSMISIYDGDSEAARHWLAGARKLNPLPPPWAKEFECISYFAEERFAEVLPGVELIPDGSWDMMYALASHGHLGQANAARSILDRFRVEGRSPDFAAGARREPYANPHTTHLLQEGLHKALAL